MRKLLAVVAALLFVFSLLPCVYRTAQWAGDAYGLVNLATLDPEAMSFNPYDRNGYLISQDMAAWILENLDYPYTRCSDLSKTIGICGMPLVNWVGRSLDMNGPESQERGYELLEHFIARKEPVNDLYQGMAPLHEAILFRNARYLRTLLSAGADPGTAISKSGKEYDGYDAYQYLEYLESKKKADWSELRELLMPRDRTITSLLRQPPLTDRSANAVLGTIVRGGWSWDGRCLALT